MEWIDFHAHVLPGVDDGSRSTEESLLMLRMSAEQGISAMVATPHFYATSDRPEEFLARRAHAMQRLLEACDGTAGLPHLYLGAEIAYFPGMIQCKVLRDLTVEGTDLLLVEMPMRKWTGKEVSELASLSAALNARVVLAHFERYLFLQEKDVLGKLLERGVLLQANASFFLDFRTRRKAIRMARAGLISFVGSDCHNMKGRAPQLGDALARISEKVDGTLPGEQAADFLKTAKSYL